MSLLFMLFGFHSPPMRYNEQTGDKLWSKRIIHIYITKLATGKLARKKRGKRKQKWAPFVDICVRTWRAQVLIHQISRRWNHISTHGMMWIACDLWIPFLIQSSGMAWKFCTCIMCNANYECMSCYPVIRAREDDTRAAALGWNRCGVFWCDLFHVQVHRGMSKVVAM